MATRASRTDVIRMRLGCHGLSGPALSNPGAVAGRMLAVQAQDYRAGLWAIGVRVPGSTVSDVARAIDTAVLVRSWPLRGTLHFVPAPDLHWMLGLSAPQVLAGMRTRRAQLGLDDSAIEGARTVALDSLSGGRELTRAGFLAALEAQGISTGGQRGYHLVANLALTGTLCWGRHTGTAQTLVLLDEWVPSPRRLEHDEALGELTTRYFRGHGPATAKDLAWWSQLTLADIRIGLGVARKDLIEIDLGGVTHFLAASAEAGLPGSAPQRRSTVFALPGFDEYLLGYRGRSVVVPDDRFPLLVPGRNGIFLPLILSDGRVVGTWRTETTPRGVWVEAAPFETMTPRQWAGFERAIDDYARFSGRPVTIRPGRGAPDPVVPLT
ncbi:winged helix DNA-binding domain-containing protein [Cryobacterium sp. TmT2-59]|uniref:winged helix DNA-binding domain-containing protein n=1 Tax=Cryobacterium sp. TmT2-59 TaxID=1259264 RepID=UPI001069B6A6|nr:winged helix DNA-binding domain-containing protein [Cryobacterium sp. TmT2-59]TFC89419.1 winged helix DNA-binding domain-containing protein [Cryobacterium sp. TmT2-59]